MSGQTLYLDGGYLAKNPGWHVEESAWKATHILRMLKQNHLSPRTVCDVGCGAGEVLKQLQESIGNWSTSARAADSIEKTEPINYAGWRPFQLRQHHLH